jgi:hypothetical protein
MGIGVAGATDHHYVRELVLAALSDRDDVMDFEPVVSCTAADAAVAITPQHTLSEGRTTRLMPAPGRRDCRRWREQRDPEEILVLQIVQNDPGITAIPAPASPAARARWQPHTPS